MTKDTSKMYLQVTKLSQIGRRYNLKSVEVAESFIKIEFNDSIVPISPQKASKRDKKILDEVKESALLEEMQLLAPEAYEEELIKRNGGLKEI